MYIKSPPMDFFLEFSKETYTNKRLDVAELWSL